MIDLRNIKKASKNWTNNKPFPHFVVDNFFDLKFAKKLEKEFINYNSREWHVYKNYVEIKKTCNNWNIFPINTYNTFCYLNSFNFVNFKFIDIVYIPILA